MIKILAFLITVLLVCNAGMFHQSDYRIKHHRLELLYYNRNYAKNARAALVPYNRTARALTCEFDLLVDLPDQIPFVMQAYKFTSNEYRLFPFRISLDFCKEVKDNAFGFRYVLQYTNTSLKCPLKKGFYGVEKYRPEETQWPPHLVSGDFKVTVDISLENNNLANLAWYGSVIKIENLWNF